MLFFLGLVSHIYWKIHLDIILLLICWKWFSIITIIGRVGPGDSGWVHNMLYDDRGYMAYHSAVHDAFGYLLTFHGIGPGYDYLKKSVLSKYNPISGQLDGINFWKKLLVNSKVKSFCSAEMVNGTFGMLLFSSDGNELVRMSSTIICWFNKYRS